MSKIKPLPPEVVAKIAAGEVVERPASVVKEMVENALDAGSRAVKVEVQGGGRKLIRVTDDGEGMTREEALLALQRHTTSKIHNLEDLFALNTFGFRGEALASIAAVSRMRVVTRRDGSALGAEVRAEGGGLPGSEETGCPAGTSVEVGDIFFNVPARLKFLKSPGTELGHIGEVVAKMALANPEVQFQLFHEGRLLAHYPVREDPSARLAEALGKDVAGKMQAFRSSGGGLTVQGHAGDPGLSRPNARGIYLFVNRRPVRDRLLHHAVLESYRNLMPKDRFPVVVLFVDLPPAEVDVNVHPSKWEVKFADSEKVHRAVIRALRDRLEGSSPLQTSTDSGAQRLQERPGGYFHAGGEIPLPVSWPSSLRSERRDEGEEGDRAPASQASFLGQIQETYLVFASSEGLILMDQHAAHERVLLTRLSRQLSQGALSRQPLLIPEVIELSPDEVKITEERLSDLGRVGFELEPAGTRTFWVKSTPEILAGHEPLGILREMVKEIASWGRGADLQRSFDSLLKMMACRGAIQANRILGRVEALALLADLQDCRFSSHCPHGRPTVLRITPSDLEKMFGRK